MNETTLRFLELLSHQDAGGVTEVCVFQDGDVPTHVGYFDNPDAAAKAIASHDERGNIFVTLDPVKRDLLARYNNHLVEGSFKRKLKRTKNEEIWRKSWFLLDIDAERSSGISSTEDELQAAIEVGRNVRDWLVSAGVPATSIVTAKSGNGAYVLVRLPDYEITPAVIATTQALTKYIAALFSTAQVKVDCSVHNAARLVCAVGTMKMKGENIAERPHRRSSIGTIGGAKFDPEQGQRCEPFDLYALAARLLPKEEPEAATRVNGRNGVPSAGTFDIRQHTQSLSNPKETARGFTYYTCPGCGGHEKLFVNEATGAYGCFHIGAGTCSIEDIRDALGRPKHSLSAPAQATSYVNGSRPAQRNQIPPSIQAADSQPYPLEVDEAAEDSLCLVKTWADFDAEHFPQGERIAFAVERGEIALLNALPNAGKTTLALNAAVSLAAGLSLYPAVDRGKARRVLYIDGETRRARLQRDLRTMTKAFERETAIAVGQNLHIICEAEIEGESLALTRINHLLQLSAEAIRVKPDFIVVDTLSSLCPVFNENDNAEQQRKVWRPLQKLARDCDAAILVLHHVGKRSEESQTPERVYRGRGASASGGAARAVWLLIPDPTTRELSTLSCVKAKGDAPPDVRLKLDPKTRWLSVQVIEPQPTVTALERVVEVVTREMKAAEIKAALKPTFQDRAVEEALAEALQLQKLKLVKRGLYAPAQTVSAPTAPTANSPDAESAEDAETGRKVSENDFPHFPHAPIGSAESAETITSNTGNGLRSFSQNRENGLVRKLVEPENADSEFPHFPHHPMTSAESAETPVPADTLRPLHEVVADLHDSTHRRRVTL